MWNIFSNKSKRTAREGIPRGMRAAWRFVIPRLRAGRLPCISLGKNLEVLSGTVKNLGSSYSQLPRLPLHRVLLLCLCMSGSGVSLALATPTSGAVSTATPPLMQGAMQDAPYAATNVAAYGSVAEANVAHLNSNLATSLTLPAQVQNLRSRLSNYGTYGASGSHVDVTTTDTYNYQVQEQGWFYYNWQVEVPADVEEIQPQVGANPVAPTQVAPAPAQVVPQVTPQPQRQATSQQSNYSVQVYVQQGTQQEVAEDKLPAVPRNITSAWLRVNLPLYLEHAVDQPTDNNVLAFLYLQAFANQKAWVFSERAKLVAQGNDYLDNNGAFPNLYTARAYREQLAKHIRATLFNKFQDKVGLILLISSDYESRAFAQLVGLFSLKYNMKFVTANLHGKFQPDLANYNQITNLREVAQLVRKQQAQIYPTLYVVNRNQTATLVTGAIDSDELEQRMLRYLFKQNYITQTEYNMARGILLDPQQSDSQLASLINGKLLQGQVRAVSNLPQNNNMQGASNMSGVGSMQYHQGVVNNPYGANSYSVNPYAVNPYAANPYQGMTSQGMPYQGMSSQEMMYQGIPNQGMSNSNMYNSGMFNSSIPAPNIPNGANPLAQVYNPYGAYAVSNGVNNPYGMSNGANPYVYGSNGNFVPASHPAAIISSYLQGGMYVP